ncbi:MAG: hypothetical protein EA397_08840 [Deltaproteobacteria bacterium]|nr:MAG: hypothetical protein EA397_08840 [Deltaproteobacteria bacterium]
MFLLFFALTFAAPPVEPRSFDEGASAPPAGAQDLIRLAVDRMGRRDFEGARILFDQAETRVSPAQGFALLPEITYHRAGLAVLEERYDLALQRYRQIPQRWPESHRQDDALFRAAEVRAILGDPSRALRDLRELPRPRRLEPADRGKLEILREIWRLDSGDARRPRRLRRAVRRAPADEIAFYVARGKARLARHAIEDAAQVDLGERPRAIRRGIRQRTHPLREAEELVREIIALREPEWIFEGVLILIEGFERFGDDLLRVPIPQELTAPQREIYLRGLQEHVTALWLRGIRYADTGRQVAARLEWSGRRVREIERRYEELEEKISAGGISPDPS